jgi:arylsulfatase A-like enzyme
MKRRSFLQLSAASPFFINTTLAQNDIPQKPNIILIYTDDQGFGDVSCYGADDLHTPNIDRMADKGVRFENWYSNSPVCSPSRAALLTGRYPQRTGLPSNSPRGLNDEGMKPSEVTIAEAVKEAGYTTGVCGKWHIGSNKEGRPGGQGFNYSFGFLSGCVDYYSHLMYWGQGENNYPYHDLWRNNEEIWENGKYITFRIADEAINFVRNNKENPFFLYLPFNAPHYPMHAPKDYFDRFAHIQDTQRRTQAAMVSALDDSIGRVYDDVERQGLLENTMFIFISDHGPSVEQRNLLDDSNQKYHGGSAGPYRGHKGSLFEGGIRVPAIMSWKGVLPEGKVCEEWGMTMDILPTIVNRAGGKIPTDRTIDGSDIFNMIQGNAKSPHHEVFWGLGNQRAMRDDTWKLIMNGRLDFEETVDEKVFLCNLNDDPYEVKNVSDQNPERTKKMMERIAKWDKDMGI